MAGCGDWTRAEMDNILSLDWTKVEAVVRRLQPILPAADQDRILHILKERRDKLGDLLS
jgi:hypothetical protein